MEEEDAVRKLSRLELRKQKLMEYLAAKGKLKPPNPKPYLRGNAIKNKKNEGNSDRGKENRGGEPARLQLGAKKLQPSAGTGRAPLSSTNRIATRVRDGSRFPAPATACPAAATRAEPQPHSAVPGLAAPLAAVGGRTVAEPTGAGSKTVTSSRNGSKAAAAGRTATEPQSRSRPITAPARTAAITSASAKTGPTATAQTRTLLRATTQPRVLSARTLPSTSTQTKARSNTTAPARTHSKITTQVKTRSDTITPAGPGSGTATLPKTGNAATASSKPAPCKAPTARAPLCIRKPVPTAPIKTACVKKSDLGTAGTRTRCSAFQKKAAVQTGKGGPVLKATVSKPTNGTKHVLHGQSLPNTVNVPLNKPQPKAARGPALLSSLPQQTPQPPKPTLRGPGASQWCRAGSRPRAPPPHAGDAAFEAPQSAARQAAPGVRREGVRWALDDAEGGGVVPNRKSPTPAPSGRVALTGLRCERALRRALERRSAPPSTAPLSTTRPCHPLGPQELKTPARTPRTLPGPGLIGTAPPRNKNLTAAQEARLQKLTEWRKAKGISYKRPPMPVRPSRRKSTAEPPHYWTAMEEEEEAQSLVYNIDRSLTDCIKLLQEGCPSEQVMDVLSGVPMAEKFAKYWICRARLMEREGDLEVLPMFQEAVRVVMEPVDDLRAVVFEILKKKEEASAEEAEGLPAASEHEEEEGDEEEDDAHQAAAIDPVTPRTTTAVIRGAKGGSSVVKYKITATPGGRRSQPQEPVMLDGQELRFFTPVRRSLRIERSASRYPSALREHDPCVASFRDLLNEEEDEEGRAEEDRGSPLYVYRENEALRDQVQVQLFQT